MLLLAGLSHRSVMQQYSDSCRHFECLSWPIAVKSTASAAWLWDYLVGPICFFSAVVCLLLAISLLIRSFSDNLSGAWHSRIYISTGWLVEALTFFFDGSTIASIVESSIPLLSTVPVSVFCLRLGHFVETVWLLEAVALGTLSLFFLNYLTFFVLADSGGMVLFFPTGDLPFVVSHSVDPICSLWDVLFGIGF